MYITDGEEHDGMTLHIINKIGGCFRKKNTNRGRSNTNRKLVNFAVSRPFYKDVVFFLFGWTAPGAGRRRRMYRRC